MTPNGQLAAAALGRVEGLGVKDYIVCAGARNAPLVTSLLSGGEAKDLRVWHHFDERTAAFFALGLAKKNSEPVAVLTTSGTAVAELLPAVIEAYYSGIPLVLVTADRPARFRGSGAPQAIEQQGIFGPYAFEAELEEVRGWQRDAPLHLNLCFEEPRVEDRGPDWTKIELPEPELCRAGASLANVTDFCREAERLVVLLGELDGAIRPEVEQFLEKLGAPVWAEATSGLRESKILQVCDDSQIPEIDPTHVLRIGGVPSLRFWRDLETLPEVEVLSVVKRPFSGLARESTVVRLTQQSWVSDLTLLGTALSGQGPPLRSPFKATPERSALAELSRHIPSEALVFLGNSLPIREWNAAGATEIPHSRCFASRGANGIDGQIATFLGLTEGERDAWGIFGDLTALYDLNAPALLEQLTGGSRKIVILNNGGGRIFSRLPSMSGLEDADKVVTENRHSCRFEQWASMWGVAYEAWKPGEALPTLPDGNVVLEILIDSE